MDIALIITEELKCRKEQVDAAIKLIDEGNTIPSLPVTEKRQPEH